MRVLKQDLQKVINIIDKRISDDEQRYFKARKAEAKVCDLHDLLSRISALELVRLDIIGEESSYEEN